MSNLIGSPILKTLAEKCYSYPPAKSLPELLDFILGPFCVTKMTKRLVKFHALFSKCSFVRVGLTFF